MCVLRMSSSPLFILVDGRFYADKLGNHRKHVAPGFKDKTRYTPYVCLGIQFTHIVTNERGNIKDNAFIT